RLLLGRWWGQGQGRQFLTHGLQPLRQRAAHGVVPLAGQKGALGQGLLGQGLAVGQPLPASPCRLLRPPLGMICQRTGSLASVFSCCSSQRLRNCTNSTRTRRSKRSTSRRLGRGLPQFHWRLEGTPPPGYGGRSPAKRSNDRAVTVNTPY